MKQTKPSGTRQRHQFEKVLQVILIAAVAVLILAVVLTVLQFLDLSSLDIISKLSQLSDASQVLQLLGIGIAGVVLMLQALIANKRARAMEGAATAQAAAARAHAEANLNTENGQRQERLKNAIEHLGSESESVRLGGAYELFHLAEDTKSLRQTVLDILCAHIRRTTREDFYKKTYASKPSGEIESLLALVFVHGHQVYSGLRVNLSESWLNGADLRGARLADADLRLAHLVKARLEDARLERVKMSGARLVEVRLRSACLRDASLVSVHLEGAWLEDAQLQGAIMHGGHLAGAVIRRGSLQGADLTGAEMYGADLSLASLEAAALAWASLEGAILDGANLRGAGDVNWSPDHSFAERIQDAVGSESSPMTVQTGGLASERIEQIASALDSPKRRKALIQQLHRYIDEPYRRGLPDGHGAILGAFTQEEAADWIDQHGAALNADMDGSSSRP